MAEASTSRICWASASVLASNFAPSYSARPASNRSDSAVDPAGLTVAVIFQYSSETNARISRLAVGDQPDGDRLDPARAQVAGDLAPEQGAELIAHEPVEEPPGLLGVDHVHVDRADVAERVLDGPLGDLVEGHAADPLVGQVERLLQVPGDRLALAVGVGRQIDHVGPGGLALQLADRSPSCSARPRRRAHSPWRRRARACAWAGRGRAPCWP